MCIHQGVSSVPLQQWISLTIYYLPSTAMRTKSTYLPFADFIVNVLMILELISSEYGQIMFFCFCKLFTDVFRNLMSRSAYSKAHTASSTCSLLPMFNKFGRVSQKNKLNL
jgi:hypothetical protein